MNILTRYVLREHIGPFLFAFVTITFLLIIDYVPRIVDQVLDKELAWGVVLELVGLNLAWMLALAVPMAVLVSTLMAFGRLTSDFEIIAIKASGINLIRVLIPLLCAAGVLTYLMTMFNDQVLPDLNKRARLLLSDISAMRPTLVFRSGMFITDVPGYLILIDKVDHETSRLSGVRITETKDPTKPRVIVAREGYVRVHESGKRLEFTLFDGEIHSLDLEKPEEYRKVEFADQKISVEGRQTGLVRTNSEFRTDREMDIAEMQNRVDIAEATIGPYRGTIRSILNMRLGYLLSDSVRIPYDTVAEDEVMASLLSTDIAAMKDHVGKQVQHIKSQHSMRNKYLIEIYKKFSIPAACIAFIMIGAPLGMLSRRGGMGVAITISIILFVIYWASLIAGEDLADRALISPFVAMWGANILLTGIGLYLIFILLSERPLFAFWRAKGG